MQRKRTIIVLTGVIALCVGQLAIPSIKIHFTETLDIATPAVLKQVACVAPQCSCEIGVGLGDNQLAFFARVRCAPLSYCAIGSCCFSNTHFRLHPGKWPGLCVSSKRLVTTPRTAEYDAAVFRRPVRVDVMLADVIHRELLNGRRYRFCTEGSDAKGRHIKVSHLARTGWVCHNSL